MRKNGSRFISFKQYRFMDLFVFGAILVIFDLIAHYAPIAFPSGADFTFTLTLAIIVIIMIRWGWSCVFFAVGDAVLQSVLNNPTVWQSYLCYAVGNCCILLLLVLLKFTGKEKITEKWYFSVLFVIFGWILQCLGLSLTMWLTLSGSFVDWLFLNLGFGVTGALSLAMGIVVILILRRLDGMFEDQKHYLFRKERERKELARRDEFGDEPIEIDEDTLSILRKREDEFKK